MDAPAAGHSQRPLEPGPPRAAPSLGAQSRKTAQAIYARLYGVRVPVDVVVVTPEDVDRYGDRVGSVIRPALREGRVIYAA